MRTAIGIQADLSMKGCVKVRSCKYLGYHGECTGEVNDATWELKNSEMTELLKYHPLFPDVDEVSRDAVCYAERNPSLRKEFCDDNITKCQYRSLYRHFQGIGQQNFFFGAARCRILVNERTNSHHSKLRCGSP